MRASSETRRRIRLRNAPSRGSSRRSSRLWRCGRPGAAGRCAGGRWASRSSCFWRVCVRPSVLRIPNLIWFRFGSLLNRIVSPVVTSLLFFLVFTPFALILRMAGKDLLRSAARPGSRQLLDGAGSSRTAAGKHGRAVLAAGIMLIPADGPGIRGCYLVSMGSRNRTSVRRATPSARETWIRKIGAKLAPGPAKVWPYTLAVALLPLIVLWHRDNALYPPPWYGDSWFYLGFFRNLVEFKRSLFLDFYYGSRLSWVLPGFLIHSLFPAVAANCVLHLTVHIGGDALAVFHSSAHRRRAPRVSSRPWSFRYSPGFGPRPDGTTPTEPASPTACWPWRCSRGARCSRLGSGAFCWRAWRWRRWPMRIFSWPRWHPCCCCITSAPPGRGAGRPRSTRPRGCSFGPGRHPSKPVPRHPGRPPIPP